MRRCSGWQEVILLNGVVCLPEDLPIVQSQKRENWNMPEAIAGRTGHVVGCACFDCVQTERFFKAMRKEA